MGVSLIRGSCSAISESIFFSTKRSVAYFQWLIAFRYQEGSQNFRELLTNNFSLYARIGHPEFYFCSVSIYGLCEILYSL